MEVATPPWIVGQENILCFLPLPNFVGPEKGQRYYSGRGSFFVYMQLNILG